MPLAPIMNMVEFKLRREAAGMTQEACAAWLGMSREAVARVETGATAVTLRTGMQAAVLFGYLAFAPIRDEPASKPSIKPVARRLSAPASVPVPVQALAPGPVPTLTRSPVYKWLDDAWSKDITDPVMQVMTDHLYWESELRPDGSLGPWRQKVRARTSDCRTDAFTNEPERIPD